MKTFFDYIKEFSFKNFLTLFVVYLLFYTIWGFPGLKDLMIVLLTLVFKHYYDSNTGSAAKDATISKALDQAQQLPATGSSTVTNADTVNIKS